MLSILEVLPWSVHTIVRVVDQEDVQCKRYTRCHITLIESTIIDETANVNMILSKHDTPTTPNDNELIDDMPASRNTLVSNQKYSRHICTIPIEQDMRKSCVTIIHSIPFSSASSPPRCSLHPDSLQHTI